MSRRAQSQGQAAPMSGASPLGQPNQVSSEGV